MINELIIMTKSLAIIESYVDVEDIRFVDYGVL